MTESKNSAFKQFVYDSAEQYLQTVVLVDDRIYDDAIGGPPTPLDDPKEAGRLPAVKSPTSSFEASGNEDEAGQMPEELEEASFRDVQNSFAERRIICSLYQPPANASFDEESEVYGLCSSADVTIVDWDLGDASGSKAIKLIGSLIKLSQADLPNQLRLVLVYTLERELQKIAKEISDALFNRHQLCVDCESEQPVLTTECARVVVLGKPRSVTQPNFSNERVPEAELAERTIREFSQLTNGILQGIVLRGIANIRDNSRRILTRFNQELDAPFLAHRALLLPDEAFRQIVTLLTDELNSVLIDTLGDLPLGSAVCVRKILEDWCEKTWEENTNAELKIGEGANGLNFVKDVFCNGPNLQYEYSSFRGSRVGRLVEQGESGNPIWKDDRNGRIKLVEYLLGNGQTAQCNEKLASLMSQRIQYGDSPRLLHLGVIVRELAGDNRYLLCLQPVCDSVRIEGKSQPFAFNVLSVAEDGRKITHCVNDSMGEFIRLLHSPKVSCVFVSHFKSHDDALCATKDDRNRFVFWDDEERGYEWIAELKTEHAQRAAEQFGRELSRVGLTESEWLRLKAK